MKRTLTVICALAITALIVSTVSAVPNVKVDDRQEVISNFFENFNFGLFNRLKDMLIDEVGMEVYNDIYARVKFIFYDHMQLSEGQGFYLTEDGTDYEFHEDMLRLDFYEGLIQVAVVIIMLMVVLFGHEGPGYALGALCATMVLFIPCCLVGIIESTVYTVGLVSYILLGTDLEQFIHDYGVVGLLLFIVLLFPLIILISIVIYPIVTIFVTFDILSVVIVTALEIVADM